MATKISTPEGGREGVFPVLYCKGAAACLSVHMDLRTAVSHGNV